MKKFNEVIKEIEENNLGLKIILNENPAQADYGYWELITNEGEKIVFCKNGSNVSDKNYKEVQYFIEGYKHYVNKDEFYYKIKKMCDNSKYDIIHDFLTDCNTPSCVETKLALHFI